MTPILTTSGIILCTTLLGHHPVGFDECESAIQDLLDIQPRPFATIVYAPRYQTPIPATWTCLTYGQASNLDTMFCWKPEKMTFDPKEGRFK